ncbi:MAG: hypothetical protein CMH27_09945 [Micavibrio sp.]|nr:hypothetical protein [Micavibrio sp.]|tara:strand:- start:2737 stop:3327 length:591 start_codon:yes stop_codon:yes gene_type:complete
MVRNIIILLVTVIIGAGLTYVMDYTASIPPAQKVKTPEPMQEVTDAHDVRTGEVVPQFSFQDIRGDEYAVDDFQGKIIILNFWASWCTPCVKEFPIFLDMAEDYKEDVVFLALSSDFDEAAMQRFLTKMRNKKASAMAAKNVIIALDDNGAITRDIFQTFRLPETIIIDREGVMRDKLIGADWSADDLSSLLEQYR